MDNNNAANTTSNKRILTIKSQLNLTDEFEIPLTYANTSMTIFLPLSYLTQQYNQAINSVGAIVYNSYPLLPANSKNISSNILSLRLFDELKSEVEVKNLTTPIKILIRKTKPDFKYCVFMDSNL